MDAAQRQRKLAARAARRKAVVAEKKKLAILESSSDGRIKLAAKGPIVRCTMPTGLFEVGMGLILVARRVPSGLLGCGFFLLDVFCLGVKDVFYAEMDTHELKTRMDQQYRDGFKDIDLACARKLVRDAAAYAAALGLPAADSTPTVEAIFGDVDANACTETFTFGKDGKPFYVAGPYDSPARTRAVMQALEKSRPGNWDYMVPVGVPVEIEP
jgi:hypothetical protein